MEGGGVNGSARAYTELIQAPSPLAKLPTIRINSYTHTHSHAHKHTPRHTHAHMHSYTQIKVYVHMYIYYTNICM